MPNSKNLPDCGKIEWVGRAATFVLLGSTAQRAPRHRLKPAGISGILRTPRGRGVPAHPNTTLIRWTHKEKKSSSVRCQLKSRSFRLVQWPSRRVLGAAKRGHHAQTSAATASVSDAAVLSYSRVNTASEGELPPAQDLSALCYRDDHLRTIVMC